MKNETTKNNNSTPVAIHLRTEVFQNNEKSEHFFEEKGQLVRMGSTLYIRYKEPQEEGEDLPVTIKIEADGDVHLIRSSEDRIRLKFTYQESNETNYRTPYGVMLIRTFTNNLHVTLKDKPVSGKVSIDYELYAGNDKLGVYHLRLEFTA